MAQWYAGQLGRLATSAMRDLAQAWQSFAVGGSVRSIAKLGGAVVLARVISALGYVAVARLYTPQDFGVFAVYLGASVVMTSIAGATYDRAIVSAPSSRRALSLLTIALSLSVMLAVGMWLVLMCVQQPLGEATGLYAYGWLFWAVPIGMVLKAGYRSVEQWAIRQGRFRAQGIAHVGGAVALVTLQVSLAFSALAGPYALIIADLIGGCAALAIICFAEGRDIRRTWCQYRRRLVLLSSLWRWRPTYTLPSALLGIAAHTAPVLVIAPIFSASIVGQVAMAVRILDLPYQLAASVFSNIAFHRIAASRPTEQMSAFRQAIRQNLLLAIGVYGIAALFSLVVVPFVLGAQWIMAAQLLIVLAPFYVGLFTTAPLMFIYIVMDAEPRMLRSRLLVVGAVLPAWASGWIISYPLWVFAIFSAAGVAAFGLTFFDMYALAKRRTGQL